MKTANSIKERIIENYENDDVELNSNFFDFDVEMKKSELLEVYANIQKYINGDAVIRLNPDTVNISKKDMNNFYISGVEEKFIPEGKYEKVYTGNFKQFLKSFNDKEAETGFCRIMKFKEDDADTNYIKGIKLDFIF